MSDEKKPSNMFELIQMSQKKQDPEKDKKKKEKDKGKDKDIEEGRALDELLVGKARPTATGGGAAPGGPSSNDLFALLEETDKGAKAALKVQILEAIEGLSQAYAEIPINRITKRVGEQTEEIVVAILEDLIIGGSVKGRLAPDRVLPADGASKILVDRGPAHVPASVPALEAKPAVPIIAPAPVPALEAKPAVPKAAPAPSIPASVAPGNGLSLPPEPPAALKVPEPPRITPPTLEAPPSISLAPAPVPPRTGPPPVPAIPRIEAPPSVTIGAVTTAAPEPAQELVAIPPPEVEIVPDFPNPDTVEVPPSVNPVPVPPPVMPKPAAHGLKPLGGLKPMPKMPAPKPAPASKPVPSPPVMPKPAQVGVIKPVPPPAAPPLAGAAKLAAVPRPPLVPPSTQVPEATVAYSVPVAPVAPAMPKPTMKAPAVPVPSAPAVPTMPKPVMKAPAAPQVPRIATPAAVPSRPASKEEQAAMFEQRVHQLLANRPTELQLIYKLFENPKLALLGFDEDWIASVMGISTDQAVELIKNLRTLNIVKLGSTGLNFVINTNL